MNGYGIGLLLYLSIISFIIYFLISILRFMRAKNHNDILLLKKLDEISNKIDKLDNK
jgi:TM2 domain-containing membrane protein YozV